jgi:hypothetical protein
MAVRQGGQPDRRGAATDQARRLPSPAGRRSTPADAGLPVATTPAATGPAQACPGYADRGDPTPAGSSEPSCLRPAHPGRRVVRAHPTLQPHPRSREIVPLKLHSGAVPGPTSDRRPTDHHGLGAIGRRPPDWKGPRVTHPWVHHKERTTARSGDPWSHRAPHAGWHRRTRAPHRPRAGKAGCHTPGIAAVLRRSRR